jgi:hypothetical protein
MSISLYDCSVASYLQILGGVGSVLAKGEEHAAAGHLDLDDIVGYRLHDDMAPFSFQLVSVWHHSLGAIKGIKAGLFEPPPSMQDMNYDTLKGLVAEAAEALEAESRDEINALADKAMVFRVRGREIPFTTTNFILSFSLPNFYFHATTLYDVLRIHGTPLGKMDYLGSLRTGGG